LSVVKICLRSTSPAAGLPNGNERQGGEHDQHPYNIIVHKHPYARAHPRIYAKSRQMFLPTHPNEHLVIQRKVNIY